MPPDTSRDDGGGEAGTTAFLQEARNQVHGRKSLPILSSPDLGGPASAAILEEPSERPTVSPLHFHVLLARAVLAALAFTAALVTAVVLSIKWGVAASPGGSPWPLLAVWACAEVVFWVWFRRHAAKLDAQPQPHMPDHQDPLLHFKRLMAHAMFYRDVCKRPIDWRAYVSTWFKGADPHRVLLGNLEDMVAYGFYYRTREQLEAEGRWHEVQAMVEELRAMGEPGPEGLGHVQPGHDSSLEFMGHLWEPLRWWHRPLAFYIITEALSWVTAAAMIGMGFRMRTHTASNTRYFYRSGQRSQAGRSTTGSGATSAAADDPPILFLHGVGLGVMPYLILVCRLAASERRVLCPEVGHVSLRVCQAVPTACQVAERVVAMMDEVNMGQACVVAHSYGTFVASRLVQAHGPRAVGSLALIDPVCFGMFLPGLLYNFIYRTPADVYRTKGLLHCIKALFLHLMSRDVHCATTFCRRFYWTDVNLWVEDLPSHTLVVLAGQDELLHADEVHAQIRQVVTGAYVGVARRAEPLTAEEAFGLKLLKVAQHSGSDAQQPASAALRRGPNEAAPAGPAAAAAKDSSAHGHLADLGSAAGSLYGGPASRGYGYPEHARVLYHPTASHAGFLLDNAWQAEIVEQVLSVAGQETPATQVKRRKTSVVGGLQLTALGTAGSGAALPASKLATIPSGICVGLSNGVTSASSESLAAGSAEGSGGDGEAAAGRQNAMRKTTSMSPPALGQQTSVGAGHDGGVLHGLGLLVGRSSSTQNKLEEEAQEVVALFNQVIQSSKEQPGQEQGDAPPAEGPEPCQRGAEDSAVAAGPQLEGLRQRLKVAAPKAPMSSGA